MRDQFTKDAETEEALRSLVRHLKRTDRLSDADLRRKLRHLSKEQIAWTAEAILDEKG